MEKKYFFDSCGKVFVITKDAGETSEAFDARCWKTCMNMFKRKSR